jgi:hypothetical protein
LVHVIDREADSAAHMRQWSAHGQHWLARVKAASTVCFGGQSMRASEVAARLKFHETRKAKPTRCDPDGKRIAPRRCWTESQRLFIII